MNNEQRIQISRSKHIEKSRAIAYLRLLEKNFLKGEVCMLNYYKDPDFRNNVSVLIAIGIKDGIGEDCFRIVSPGGTVPVEKVVDNLEDVSSLVHDELYIYHDLTKKTWNYIYLTNKQSSEPNRIIEPITGGPFIFVELDSGYRWFYSNQTCKREDEFFSSKISEDLLQSFIETKIVINVEVDGNRLYKVGDIIDLTVKVEAKNQIGEIVNNRCKFYLVELDKRQEIKLNENNCFILPKQSQGRQILIEAVYAFNEDIHLSYFGSTNIIFGYNFYYGIVSDDWEPTLESIKKLKEELHYKNDFIWENITLTRQKTVLCYPLDYKKYLEHIFDVHGIDYIYSYQAIDPGVIIDNQPYVCYILKEPINITNFKQIFTFSNIESLEVEEVNLNELLTAWKNKNNINGLVVLNKNGKIPNDLIDINVSSSFTILKDIVKENPTENLVRGDLYYNEVTKKIFKALSDSTGVIEDPIPGNIYRFDNDLLFWTGLSLQPISRISTEPIDKLEDIYG